ncbi:MAG: aspartate kinase [Silvanigrellales bacterium]|nr:aspartate kinase [Silvanigrellales bacterium]
MNDACLSPHVEPHVNPNSGLAPVPDLGPVFKFGGTSMGSLKRIAHVADLCIEKKPSAVVVSAMAGETNRLVGLARELSPRTDVPEYDMLVASGEQVSVALLSLALRERGLKPWPMLAPQAGIRTDAQFSKALIQSVDRENILRRVREGYLPVIAGFQGVTADGQFTSLGRGGSDTSAVAVAAGLGASECVIYTDVDGVYTTDPRICPTARILRRVNYEEMLEMASQGSKVLHIRSVQLAAKWGIRLFVRNTFSNDEGTEMTNSTASASPIEGEVVSGVAASNDEAWLTVGPLPCSTNVLFRVFSALAERGVNVDIITQSLDHAQLTVNFTVSGADVLVAEETIRDTFPGVPLQKRTDVAKVSIVGVGMRTHAGVAARLFKALASKAIDVLLVTTSEIKVACLIERSRAVEAVQALHAEFIDAP